MANPFVTQAPALADDPGLDRRMRMAQMLREQSMQGFGPTESFMGHAVKRSPLEGVAKVVQALMASKMDKENEPGLAKLAQKRDAQQALIDQMQRLQLGQAQRESDLATLPGQFATPAGVAGADGTDAGAGMGGGTPTPAGFDMQGYAQALMAKDPRQGLALQQALQKPAAPPLVSKPGDVARDPKTGAILWHNPEAADGEKDAFLRVMKAAGIDAASPQGRAMLSSYLTKLSTHQPATSVNVNTGQKGLDNERNLRNDFRGDASVKAFEEMQAAHKQIKAGLASANPVGDLAAATKMMKLLDPGSVVRESELGMAMAASGRMDRLQNYLDMQIKGTKLTPTQRVEFAKLADDLMAASGQVYNAKHAEYTELGNRYKLDTAVLGKQWAPGAKPGTKPPAATAKPAPKGVDPSVWGAMTAEERALWN